MEKRPSEIKKGFSCVKDTSMSLPKDDTLIAMNYSWGFVAVSSQYFCFCWPLVAQNSPLVQFSPHILKKQLFI